MEIITNLAALDWSQIGLGLLTILGGASVIAKVTPTEADNKAVDFVYKIVHAIGLTKK